ncbi:MAG: polyprenyl synthetase family protein [Pseudomonadales bacterium]|nr:polyprenyl synthetase family protein [Pseudomonadales bacterium]
MQSSYAIVADEFSSVNDLITQQLTSEVGLVENISQYLVASGGKRIRPLITLLAAGALNQANNQKQIQLATAVEFLHTATLLHDDVVDMSTLRRGQPTANANWGNASSVLVGDFVYSKAFQLMVGIGSLEVMQILSDTTTKIAEGEVQQLMAIGDLTLSEDDYFNVIRNKTAQLFEGACQASAVTAGASKAEIDGIGRYGLHLGLAFQLVDDYLDYSGNSDDLGKNVGDDLAEGKLTLPLIEALRITASQTDTQNKEQHALLVKAISEKDLSKIENVIRITQDCGALEITLTRAKEQVELAKTALKTISTSAYKDELIKITDFVISRTV